MSEIDRGDTSSAGTSNLSVKRGSIKEANQSKVRESDMFKFNKKEQFYYPQVENWLPNLTKLMNTSGNFSIMFYSLKLKHNEIALICHIINHFSLYCEFLNIIG